MNTNFDNSLISKFRHNHYGESLSHAFGFQREFWRHRAQTGSVKASSPGLARAMVEPLWEASTPQEVLEVGSGTGTISERIFRRMRPDDRLTIVEINRNFLSMTRRKLLHSFGDAVLTGRVSFVNSDFLKHPMPDAHYSRICCSLPFNNFAPEVIQRIFQDMFRVCRPGGIVVYYEYILLRRIRYWLSLGTQRKLKRIEAVLSRNIDQYGIERIPIFSNFPPAMVYVLRKPAS